MRMTFAEQFKKNSSQATRRLLKRIKEQCVFPPEGNVLADINTVLKSDVGRGRFVKIIK